MKKFITAALMIVIASLASYSSAHSGRTDANGGHNCSQKSINKGLCTGYHYHNNTSIDQPEQLEVVVSAVSQEDNKAATQHSHDHDSQEG
mgnify:FL=1